MRRSSIPLVAVVLAVVTAIVLLRAAQAITAGMPVADPIETNRALTYRFYEGINLALRTGDPALVSSIVAADYTEPDQLGATPGPAGLRQRLAALHTTNPDLELVVTDVLVRGNLVVARLDVRGGREATFLGAPLSTTPAPWGSIDFLRIEHERVVERRGGGDLAPSLTPLWTATVDDPPVVAQFALTRLTFAPVAATGDLRNQGPALIAVEAGSLTIATVDPQAPNQETVAHALGKSAAERQRPATLGPGQPIALPVATPYALRNDGPMPVVALVVAFFPSVRGERAAPVLPAAESLSVALLLHGIEPPSGSSIAVASGGVAADYLGGGPLYGLPSTAAALAGGRVLLAPGASVPLPATMSTALLVVEAGTGEVAIAHGLAQTRYGPTAPIISLEVGDDPTFGQTAALADGGAAFLPPNAAGTLRNTGDQPLRALLVRVAPNESDATT